MIIGQRDELLSPAERGPGIAGVGADNLILGDGNHHSSGSSCQICRSHGSLRLLFLVLQQFLNSRFQLHGEFNMDESLSQGLPDVALSQSLALQEDLEEVRSYELGDFASAVAVEHPVESDVVVAGDGVVGDVGVLHVLAPPLHLAHCEFELASLVPAAFLGGDRLVQKAVSHRIKKYQSRVGILNAPPLASQHFEAQIAGIQFFRGVWNTYKRNNEVLKASALTFEYFCDGNQSIYLFGSFG